MPRHPLSAEFAVELARAAADEPSFVAFVGTGTEILIAARPHDLAPLDVEDACRRLLAALSPEERGRTYLVSVDPGFGTDPTAALAVWPELERIFTAAGGTLLDWLLVCDESAVSVAAAARSSLAVVRQ